MVESFPTTTKNRHKTISMDFPTQTRILTLKQISKDRKVSSPMTGYAEGEGREGGMETTATIYLVESVVESVVGLRRESPDHHPKPDLDCSLMYTAPMS